MEADGDVHVNLIKRIESNSPLSPIANSHISLNLIKRIESHRTTPPQKRERGEESHKEN